MIAVLVNMFPEKAAELLEPPWSLQTNYTLKNLLTTLSSEAFMLAGRVPTKLYNLASGKGLLYLTSSLQQDVTSVHDSNAH